MRGKAHTNDLRTLADQATKNVIAPNNHYYFKELRISLEMNHE